MSGNSSDTTFLIKASRQGWQGPVSELARLLSVRFSLVEADVQEALESDGEAVVAHRVSADGAERLREILARIGVNARLEADGQASPVSSRSSQGDAPTLMEETMKAWAMQAAQGASSSSERAARRAGVLSLADAPASMDTVVDPRSPEEISAALSSDASLEGSWSDMFNTAESRPEQSRTVHAEKPVRESGTGWDAVLSKMGGALPPAASAPSVPRGSTGEWEVTIETEDSSQAFVIESPDEGVGKSMAGIRPLSVEAGSKGAGKAPPERPKRHSLPAMPSLSQPREPESRPAAPLAAPVTSALPAVRPQSAGSHSPLVAAILGVIFPGAGQVYNGQFLKGAAVGVSCVLVFPWLWGIWDAWRVGGAIRGGSSRYGLPGSLRDVGVYVVVASLLASLCSYGVSEALDRGWFDEESPETRMTQKMRRRIAARGSAEIAMERAFYRADRAKQEAEAELRKSGGGADSPGFGLPQHERERRAVRTLTRARAACSANLLEECRSLLQEARALDPANKEAWKLTVILSEKIDTDLPHGIDLPEEPSPEKEEEGVP